MRRLRELAEEFQVLLPSTEVTDLVAVTSTKLYLNYIITPNLNLTLIEERRKKR